jgi:acetyl-CoA carboxylase carboxyl transferase subunit alpha
MAARMKHYLSRTLAQLREIPADDLVQQRYEKFRQMGRYLEAEAASS